MSVSFAPRKISHATNAARSFNPMSDKILNQMPQTQLPFATVCPMSDECVVLPSNDFPCHKRGAQVQPDER